MADVLDVLQRDTGLVEAIFDSLVRETAMVLFPREIQLGVELSERIARLDALLEKSAPPNTPIDQDELLERARELASTPGSYARFRSTAESKCYLKRKL